MELSRPLARPPGPGLRRKCMGPARARSRAQAHSQGPGPHFLLNIGPGGRASGRLSSKTAKSQTCFISNMLYRLVRMVPKTTKKGFQIPKKGFAQKFKVPKLVCRSPLDHFEAAPTLFQAAQPHFCDIWPRSRPNIRKNTCFRPFGAGYPSCGLLCLFVDCMRGCP